VRIGVVTTSFPREAGDPAGHFALGFARWLSSRGAAVDVVAAGPGASRVEGIAVARVDGRGLFYRGGAPDALAGGGAAAWARAAAFQAALAAAVARRAASWDAVASHWIAPSAIAVEAARVAARGLRHLAIAHSSDVWLLQRSNAGRAALRLVARRADLVYAAPHLARAVDGAPGRVVPMAIHAADVQGGDRKRGRERLRLERTTALFLGRLIPIKGVDMLLAALPDALDLVVAGEGPLRAALERRAPPRVRFVGEVRGADKADLLAACDLLVAPSLRLPDGRQEGTPTVLREALAAGLPIVATRSGGVGALLDGNPAALVVEPEPSALRGALRLVVERPGLLAGLSAAARAGSAEHDWSRVGPILAGSLLDGGAHQDGRAA
jgi:glycosyltransferase involved in cell wall biosynthesis